MSEFFSEVGVAGVRMLGRRSVLLLSRDGVGASSNPLVIP